MGAGAVGNAWKKAAGGDGGIRTLDRALQPYNGLANRRLQPLGHSSVKADMPDAGASRKRQISARGFPSDLMPDPCASNELEAEVGRLKERPEKASATELLRVRRKRGGDWAAPLRGFRSRCWSAAFAARPARFASISPILASMFRRDIAGHH